METIKVAVNEEVSKLKETVQNVQNVEQNMAGMAMGGETADSARTYAPATYADALRRPQTQLVRVSAADETHAERQTRQMLLDKISGSESKFTELEEKLWVAKANEALDMLEDRTSLPVGAKFLSARVLKNGGLLMEANSAPLIDCIRDDEERRREFEAKFDGGRAIIKNQSYTVKVYYVPVSHEAGNKGLLREIEETSGLEPMAISETAFFKPVHARRLGQKVAHARARFTDPYQASLAIRQGLVIDGKRCNVERLMPEARRCFNCHKIGSHRAVDCREPASCGKCGSKDHESTDCENENPQEHYCVNCDIKGHAHWSPGCPAMKKASENTIRKDRYYGYKYFPCPGTGKEWTWQRHDGTTGSMAKEQQARGDGQRWNAVRREFEEGEIGRWGQPGGETDYSGWGLTIGDVEVRPQSTQNRARRSGSPQLGMAGGAKGKGTRGKRTDNRTMVRQPAPSNTLDGYVTKTPGPSRSQSRASQYANDDDEEHNTAERR